MTNKTRPKTEQLLEILKDTSPIGKPVLCLTSIGGSDHEQFRWKSNAGMGMADLTRLTAEFSDAAQTLVDEGKLIVSDTPQQYHQFTYRVVSLALTNTK
jgi:hypothetical protein